MALRSARCAICWAPATNNHHHPPVSQVGKHDDTITLCGNGNADGCHGLAHHNGGNLHLIVDDPWQFWADEKAAKAISARRSKYSKTSSGRQALAAVKDGSRYTVRPIETSEGLDEFPDDYAEPEALTELIMQFRQLDETKTTAHYYQCVTLASIKAATDGDFTTIRQEQLGLGESAASKMLSVATHLSDLPEQLHTLPIEYMYYLARAVKRGDDRSECYADAAVMPQRDFIESRGLVRKRDTEPKPLTCPKCGEQVTLKELKEGG